MNREVRVYFEGDPDLRGGFHSFLADLVEATRRRKIRLRLIAGEGNVVRDFMKGLDSHPDALNLLILDSEGPDNGRLLEARSERSDWKPPTGRPVDPRQVYFMVQCMETWFLADRDALQRYYGSRFRAGRLPPNPRIEEIPKEQVVKALQRATEDTAKGRYHKTRHAPDLLALLDVHKVRAAAPHCDRLFVEFAAMLKAYSSS